MTSIVDHRETLPTLSRRFPTMGAMGPYRLLWCRDTRRGCSLLFAGGVELEIFVEGECSYARWWMVSSDDEEPICLARWGVA